MISIQVAQLSSRKVIAVAIISTVFSHQIHFRNINARSFCLSPDSTIFVNSGEEKVRQWQGRRSSGWAGNLSDIVHPLQWRQNSEIIQLNRFVQIKSWKALLAEHCDILPNKIYLKRDAIQTLTWQSSENPGPHSQLWVAPIHFLISLHEK